ncbi:oligosaccharide flippase family protein [Bacillus megaterium]|nr:oligosaccharide flippase family protein [Priestia megaterium]
MYQVKNFNFLGKYFDEIIVGRILNVEILGYYYVAKQLIEKSVTLISSNVNKVFYPLYSELVKRKMVINHLSHNTF